MFALRVSAFAFAAVLSVATHAFAADGDWVVRKATGEVWTGGAQPVALGAETVLKPGDTVTTGRNGRVLLVRGQETILVAPNSVIGIPADKKDGLATTITQRAGSILLEVEKKNVPHFEVETPYLAAVVKGTQFRVSVTETGARVEVTRGKVQVADFKSGQIAQVLPGQAAEMHVHSSGALHLSGAGTFLPIEHGAPRNSTIEPIKVPKGGLQAPQGLERARAREADRAPARGAKATTLSQDARPGARRNGRHETRAAHAVRPGVIRISAPLGEMRLNVHKVTHGLVRNSSLATDSGRRQARESTIWNSDNGLASANAMGAGNNTNNGIGNGNGGGAMSGGGASGGSSGSSAAAVAAGGGNGNSNAGGNGNGNGNAGGNGNGNGKVAGSGNGNGNGNGAGNGNGNGAGNGNGNGNGGNGNGNGNGGVGNGNGKGNTKH